MTIKGNFKRDCTIYARSNKSNSYDFFETPSFVTEALLDREKFAGNILEPCCGKGAISEVLKKYNYKVFSSDICNYNYGKQRDFFKNKKYYDNIITNPPYSMGLDMVLHSLKYSRKKVVMLLRISFLEGVKRYNKLFKQTPPGKIYIFTRRINYGTGKTGGMMVTGWFIWSINYKGKTNIEWINI